MTLPEFRNGHTDGKCLLIRTLRNKLRKCCFLTKLRRHIIFNGNTVQKVPIKSTFGLMLDEKLTFNDHIASKLTTVNKLISILRKLYHYMPVGSLVTICKSFIRPHLDYADVIFDKPSNTTFSNRIESAQYNAALAITGTIRGTSKGKLYQELGFEIMKDCGVVSNTFLFL